MKKSLLFLLALIISGLSYGQLTGSKAIPGTPPTGYATLAAAITDLNAQGVGTGGVTFNVAAGYTETFSTALSGFITATGTSANPITFQKSGSGANPVITASGAGTIAASTTLGSNGDGVVIIEGGDYITFDGINIQENAGASTTTTRSEYGYYLKKASATDAPKNVTIKNCAISLNKANIYTFGVFVSNFVGTSSVTVTSTGGISENIKIHNNTFSNVYGAVQLRGYAASSPYDFYDQNIEIGKDGANTITDIGGGSTAMYGIYTIYQNDLTIANNSFTGTIGGTGAYYVIYTSTATNASTDIYNNSISHTFTNTTGAFYGFYNSAGSSGTSNTLNFYNNSVSNCNYSTATTGSFYGIYHTAGVTNINFYGNTISNNQLGSATTTGTGTFYLIYSTGTPTTLGTYNYYDNTLSNNTRTQSAVGGGTNYGFYIGGSGNVLNFYNNNISNFTTGSSGTTYIHYNLFSGTVKNVYDNSAVNILNANSTVYGLYNGNGTTGYFYNNKFQNLNMASASGTLYGIYQSSGTSMYYYNNFIGELKAPAATGNPAIYGAYLSGTTVGFYNNTIYLNATSTGASFGASGIYASTTPTVELRNNIVVNNSTPGATGRVVAYHRSSSTLTTYAST
ncbi:MAG: hypothetical protein H8D67_13355, partial [Deltaproteobacteria bacterium]|nr:hypothetical protein [Deltaproteobacteria bacterium]